MELPGPMSSLELFPAPSSVDREPGPTAPAVRPLVVVSVLLAAAVFGALTEWLQGVLHDPWAMWANSIVAWLIVAFAAGAVVRRPVPAAALGVGAELALLAGYYVARTIQGVASGTEVLLFWVGGAVVGGVVFGLAGAWWRSPIVWRQVVGLALLAGALVGEGAVRWAMFPWQGASGAVMCAVGVVVAVALARGQRQRWVTPLALVVVVPLALAGNHLSNAVIVG